MSQSADRVVDPGIADSTWKTLYIIGGVAALIAVVFFRRNCGAELVGFQGFGLIDVPAVHPSTAFDWFMLLQDGKLVGLVLLNLLDLVNYVLVGLIFLTLYAALRPTNKSAPAWATPRAHPRCPSLGFYF